MIESLKSTLAASQPPTNEKLKELYNQLKELDRTYFSNGVQDAEESRKAKLRPGWSFLGIFKTLFSIVFAISFIKMLCFPTVVPDNDEILRQTEIKLNYTEHQTYISLETEEEKDEYVMQLKVQRQKEFNLAQKKEKEAQEKRSKDYFKKITSKGEGMLWAMRYDFYEFADKKGGLWAKLKEKVKERNDRFEAEIAEKKAKEEEEEKK